MFPPTMVTWILVVFGLIFQTKDPLIGKGGGWRARTLNFAPSNIYKSRGKVK